MKSMLAILLGLIGLSAIAGAACQAPAAGSPACPSGACAMTPKVVSEDGIQLLSAGEMKKIVDAKSARILDARSGKYDDGKRIPGATQLSPESSKEDIEKLLPDKKAAVVTYCSNLKCPASAALAKKLKSLGYADIKEYPEGIQGWQAGGNPVEEPAKAK